MRKRTRSIADSIKLVAILPRGNRDMLYRNCAAQTRRLPLPAEPKGCNDGAP